MFEIEFDDDASLPWTPDEDRNCITSPDTGAYNCFAWALGRTDGHIQPTPGITDAAVDWPKGVPKEWTIDAFTQMLRRHDFVPCDTPDHEPGTDKIALYAVNKRTPAHAARQLPNGQWTSKLGGAADVMHVLPEDVECRAYGRVVGYFKRQT